jgi:tRNA (cmo5U34)-methyltransferase
LPSGSVQYRRGDGQTEATQQSQQAQRPAAQGGRPREDWFDDEFVVYWINQQESRFDERNRQFVRLRAVLPRDADEEFRYIDLGAGAGHLDVVLLEHFGRARATILDGSPAMLAGARNRLARFGDRVEFVQGNLATPEWIAGVQGPFDAAVSTIALHNLWEPRRLRQLYAEVHELLGEGGLFLNLDYVRATRPALAPLAAWAAKDPDAGFDTARGGAGFPGTVEEQLGWLREAGFAGADCPWKEFSVALMLGVRGGFHIPQSAAPGGPR